MAVSSRQSSLIPVVFGLELRTAFSIDLVPTVSKKTHAQVQVPSLRRFFLRNASEPIIYSYADRLASKDLTIEEVAPLTSALLGKSVSRRTGDQYSRPKAGAVTRYISAGDFDTAWQTRSRRLASGGAVMWAIQRFLDFNQIHPFEDGNGRTSRALLCADIANMLECGMLFLPVGPVLYDTIPRLMAAYSAIARDQAAEPFFNLLLEILETAVSFAEDDLSSYLSPQNVLGQ